jgi:hypothetical protein
MSHRSNSNSCGLLLSILREETPVSPIYIDFKIYKSNENTSNQSCSNLIMQQKENIRHLTTMKNKQLEKSQCKYLFFKSFIYNLF